MTRQRRSGSKLFQVYPILPSTDTLNPHYGGPYSSSLHRRAAQQTSDEESTYMGKLVHGKKDKKKWHKSRALHTTKSHVEVIPPETQRRKCKEVEFCSLYLKENRVNRNSPRGINHFEAIPYINTCWDLLSNFPLLFTFCTKGCKYAKLYYGSIHTVSQRSCFSLQNHNNKVLRQQHIEILSAVEEKNKASEEDALNLSLKDTAILCWKWKKPNIYYSTVSFNENRKFKNKRVQPKKIPHWLRY